MGAITKQTYERIIGLNALAHGTYCRAFAILNRCLCVSNLSWVKTTKPSYLVSFRFAFRESLVINSQRFYSQAHVIIARYTEFYRACTKICRQALDSPKFFCQCFKSTILPKFLTTKVFYYTVLTMVVD